MTATTTSSTELINDGTVLETCGEVDEIIAIDESDDEITFVYSDGSTTTTSLDGSYASATTVSSDGDTSITSTTVFGNGEATTTTTAIFIETEVNA